MLGQWLTDEARRWISRSHVRFELRGADLVVQDVSTNGTGVRPGGSMDDDERVALKQTGRGRWARATWSSSTPGCRSARRAPGPPAASSTRLA